MNPREIIRHPLLSEKAMYKVDKENKIVFIVSRRANKNQIREAVEKIYGVKVADVNTQITTRGIKRAYVQLEKGHSAVDLMTKAGMI